MIVKTQSWQKVMKFYRDITEKNTFFRPMLDLAEQIAASKYARGLFPWTSMQTLCISQTEEANSDKEVCCGFRWTLGMAFSFTISKRRDQHCQNISTGSEGVRRRKAFPGLRDL